MSTRTPYFNLLKPAGTDAVDISQLNDNFDIIDTEMHKPPLTINGETPDSNRNIHITTVPLADNLVSDESQIAVGDFVLRSSGGDASIASGTANISTISGNSVKTGFVQEVIYLTAVPLDPNDDDAITATVDRNTLVAYMQASGTVTFTFTTAWNPAIAPYGITVSGTPVAGDQIILEYTKGNRGTISIPNPVKFISTGWNLYNHTAGYARVPKYSDVYGFIVSGSYTSLEFSTTQTGTRSTITPISGYFTIPADGYVFVTGGNNTNTAIYMTWSDWTDGTPEEFAPYSQDEIDLSGVMVNFPNGLMRVGAIADEINFNTQTAIKRIERIPYSEEDLNDLIANDIPYDTDTNYIYYVRDDIVTYSIDLDGDYTASDHGTEFFTGTTIPTYASILYGQDLAGKLRRDVLTISPQELTDDQKKQARKNIDAADSTLINGIFKAKHFTGTYTSSAAGDTGASTTTVDLGDAVIEGYSLFAIKGFYTGHTVLVPSRIFINSSNHLQMNVVNPRNTTYTNKTAWVDVIYVKNGIVESV